jgi:hypothetical protein
VTAVPAKSSKNQRAIKTSPGQYSEIGNISRFIPLQSGFCYLNDPRNGKVYHLKVGSSRFEELVAEIASKWGVDRMQESLADMVTRYPGTHWVQALESFQSASEAAAEVAAS